MTSIIYNTLKNWIFYINEIRVYDNPQPLKINAGINLEGNLICGNATTDAGIIANVNGVEHEFMYRTSNNAWGTIGDLNIDGNITSGSGFFIGDDLVGFTPYVLSITTNTTILNLASNRSTRHHINNLTASSFPGYTDYTSDFNFSTWQPSLTGIYHVYAQAYIQSPEDRLTDARLMLREESDALPAGTNVALGQTTIDNKDTPTDSLIGITLNFHIHIHVTQATIDNQTRYTLRVTAVCTPGSTGFRVVGDNLTRWIIHRIA